MFGLPHNAKPIPYKEDRIRLDSYQNKGSDLKRIQAKKGIIVMGGAWGRETKQILSKRYTN